MSDIKVNPEELRKNIDLLATNVHGMQSVSQQLQMNITKNTCTNIVDYKNEIDNVRNKCSQYTAKFQQNLTALLKSVNIIEDMDKKIKEAVDSNTAAFKARNKQQ